MAEESEKKEDKENKNTAKAKVSKKILFVVAGLVLVLVAIGVPLFLMLNKTEDKPSASAEKVEIDFSAAAREQKLRAEAEEEIEEGEEILGALIPLDPFVLNLKGSRFIKFQVQIEFIERDIPKKFLQRAAIIRDGIITLVNTRSPEDILERDGKEKLRKDIRNVVNEALRKELVKQVYFTQFVVQ